MVSSKLDQLALQREAACRAAVDLCFMYAKELASLIRTREVSAREVMAAHLEQI